MNIGIVEDEVLTAETIALHVRNMGYSVVGIYSNYDSVFQEIAVTKPDLFLIDIRIKGAKTGLDIAKELYSQYAIPFLFLTSHTDFDTVRKAMCTQPLGYITKPFSYEDLFIGIELVKAKITHTKPTERKIEIKNGYQTEWLSCDNILFLEADRSYVKIYLTDGSRVLRQSLRGLLKSFDPGEMVRIHRSFAVNPLKIERVTGSKVIIAGQKIPLGPGYRDFLQSS